MKKFFSTTFILTFLLFFPGVKAQELNNKTVYDSTLAQKLGADE